MPFRLILVLLLVLFEGAFIGFNLENTCNVWLFKTFEAVPVYITVLVSFAAGALLFMLFFAFGRKRRRKALRQEGEGKAAPYKEKRQGHSKAKEKGAMAQEAKEEPSSFAAPSPEAASSADSSERPSAPAGGAEGSP